MRHLIAFAALAVATPALATPDAPSLILKTAEARDVLTYARPEIARVTHVDLALKVNFETKTIGGTAALNILAIPGATEIVLDTDNLNITSVADGKGRPLKFVVGARDATKGAPLTVQIGTTREIVIRYSTGADASALGWLPASLTAGRKKPYLYTQGQPINNRSWIPTQDSPGIRQSWTASITVPSE